MQPRNPFRDGRIDAGALLGFLVVGIPLFYMSAGFFNDLTFVMQAMPGTATVISTEVVNSVEHVAGAFDRADFYRDVATPRVFVSIASADAKELRCVIAGDLNVFGVGDAGNENEIRRKLEDLESQRRIPVRYRIGEHGPDCRFHVAQGTRWIFLLVFSVAAFGLAFAIYARPKRPAS